MSNKKNYNKISTDNAKNAPVETKDAVSFEETPVVEETVTEPVVESVRVKTGIVCNCTKLNIRKAPNANAEILGTLDLGAAVAIRDEVGDFYKIGDPDSSEYCMKKYISINK